ncbi:hypothetical protein ACTXT7_006860 [Hymenolepis weldensis]
MSLESSPVIRVGSRKSQLALRQTDLVIHLLRNYYPDYKFEIVKISTTGDNILEKALSKIGDKNLFTKELEVALLNNEIDFAVHSLKDVPTVMPEGLVIGCICARVSPFDVVLMNPVNRGKTLRDLPPNSVIGTSALRRIAVLKRQFPDLCFTSIRGNLATRLQKLDASVGKIINTNGAAQKYDALILAEAGVLRVGWESRIDEVGKLAIFLDTWCSSKYLDLDRYAVGQGALACECRLGDTRIQTFLSTIHSEAPALACISERAFMSRLEGGCSTPIAVRTYLNPGGVAGIKGDDAGKARTMSLDAAVLSLDGTRCVEGKLSTDLPFSMPWDCRKRARRDKSETSSQPMFLNDEISEQSLDDIKELLKQNNGNELVTSRKRKEQCQHSADSLRTSEFVRRVHGMMDGNHGKSMQHLAKDLQVRGEFMWIKRTHENRLMYAKGLLKKLKHPEEEECLWFFSDKKNFHQDEKTSLIVLAVTGRSNQRIACLRYDCDSAEEESAKDENSIILGVQVYPICGVGRLRMVRARSLGEALADHLRAAGAGEILAEIRETGTSKSDPVKPKQIQQSISIMDSDEKASY